MPDPIAIIIPGDAVPKGRPRLSTIAGHATAYTPAKTRAHEGYLRAMFAAEMAQRGLQALQGPVSVNVTVFRAIPASWSNRKQSEARAGAIFPTTKPDLDNLVKSVLDAANGILFADDAQIVELMAKKIYEVGGGPKTLVSVIPLL